MKKMIIALILLMPFPLFACGDYVVIGEVKMVDGVSRILVNPKTVSELNFRIEMQESAKLTPYIGRYIKAVAKMSQEMDKTIGLFDSIDKIEHFEPDFLLQGFGTKLTQVKKEKCKKK